MTKDNNLLGQFELTGIPPAPRGVPQIEVTFEIDVNGILKVSAHDKGTGKSESITITNDKSRLSQEEIERMIREAESMEAEDKAVLDRVEAGNAHEGYLHGLKTQVNDDKQLGGKLAADDKKTILDALKTSIDWYDANKETATKEDFEEKKSEVENIVNPITSKLYEGTGGGSSATDEDAPSHDEL